MLYWDFIKYTPERYDDVENADRMLTSSNSTSRKKEANITNCKVASYE